MRGRIIKNEGKRGLSYTVVVDTGKDPITGDRKQKKKTFKAKKEEGINVTFHGLRHAHASYLLKQGIHPKVVSERLGHSNISMTMDLYSHIAPTLQSEAASKLDELLFKKAKRS